MSLSDWTIANPESAGLHSEPLRDMIEWLDGFGHANVHSGMAGCYSSTIALAINGQPPLVIFNRYVLEAVASRD